MLKYGGFSRRERALGLKFHGPFIGSYATQKHKTNLKDKLRNIDFAHNSGLNLNSTLTFDSSTSTSTSSSGREALLKWYEQPETEKRVEAYNSDRWSNNTSDVPLTNSFGRRGSFTPSSASAHINTRHSRNSSFVNQSASFSYPFNCILPSPDGNVTPGVSSSTNVDVLESLVSDAHVPNSRLLHLDYNNSMVIGYFTSDSCEPESGVGSIGMGLEHSVTHIAVFNISEQAYFVVR